MNGTMNNVFMVGRLGDVPEIRYTKDGKAVANFSLATSRSWKNEDGEKQEITTWLKIVCWGNIAEYASKYLSKGSRVGVVGHLENREWFDKENNKRNSVEIVASEVNGLDTRAKKLEAQVSAESIL